VCSFVGKEGERHDHKGGGGMGNWKKVLRATRKKKMVSLKKRLSRKGKHDPARAAQKKRHKKS